MNHERNERLERLESGLRDVADPDADRYRPRPLPASIGEARAVLRSSSGGRRPVMWRALGAAAAAVAVALVALALNLPGSGAGVGSGGSPSADASAPSAAGSPAGPAPCRAADFAVASDPWDAGAGSRGTRVVFRVVDSVAGCLLGGSASARITDAAGTVLVQSQADATPSGVLGGGDQVEIGVAWSNWCGDVPEGPLALELLLAGDSTAIPLVPPAGSEILVPPCMGPGQPSNLSVTRFEPSDRPPLEG